MSAATAIAAPQHRQEVSRVVIDDDATPLVRLIGRTLYGADLDAVVGTVAVRSHDTPQAATITIDQGAVTVSGGVLGAVDASVVVDLHARFVAVEEPAGDPVLGAAVLAALAPTVPPWREAAERFWEVTRSIPGIPDILDVEAHEGEFTEQASFGAGGTHYLIAGPADLLAGVFCGADDLLESLGAGVRVQGTLSQLSVMTAASWKVRFDV